MTYSIPPELHKEIQEFEKKLALFESAQTAAHNSLEFEVMKYFDQWGYNPSATDLLFTQFIGISNHYYAEHNYEKADEVWEVPLEYAAKWEKGNNKLLHKGTPYYCRGMTAIAAGNIDRGFLFFHQALDEDNRIPGQRGWGPAWSFVYFDYKNPRQAALRLIKPRAEWLDSIISKYRSSGRGSLTKVKLRNHVLKKKRLKETSFSFIHTVFRSHNLLSMPARFRSSPFASQLALDILFSLCRIAEIWLKNKQKPKNKNEEHQLRQLGGQLLWFFKSQSSQVSDIDLTNINKVDLDLSLKALLDDKRGVLPRRFQPWEADLMIIYLLRNHAGHETTSSSVVCQRFDELLERLFFGLFCIVENLYRS